MGTHATPSTPLGHLVLMASAKSQWVQTSTSRMRAGSTEPSVFEAIAARASVEWAGRWGLAHGHRELAKVEAIRCGSCAAHAYPSASSDVVIVAAKLITWLFLFDDAYGESLEVRDEREKIEIFASYETAIRTGVVPSKATSFHAALVDLMDSCTALADSDWLARFADSMGVYFAGCMLEYPYRVRDQIPTLEEYRRLRSWSIGMHPVFDLVELARNSVMPRALALCGEVQALRERTAQLCAWVNDVYSYGKEKQGGVQRLNLVGVLSNELEISEPDAFVAAAEVFNVDLERFEQQVAALDPDGPAELHQYAAGLTDWVNGNYTWTALSRRYGPLAVS